MDAFDSIRDRAAKLHRELVADGVDPLKPDLLVQAAAKKLKLRVAFLQKGDPALKGAKALYDDQAGVICCEATAKKVDGALFIAHEIGHASSHAGSTSCSAADIDPSSSTESAPVGMQRVEDYGARERRELQANVFARELLFPKAFARELHLQKKMTAEDIAQATGLPANLVRQQLFDALLLPAAPTTVKTNKKSDDLKPDPSQERASSHKDSAFQLQAGPGTGKTRTLIQRVLWLLEQKADASSILVLTFSKKAAGELVERLEAAVPLEAPKIWVGTFHAFGLDLVRRYYDRLGLPPDPVLFDLGDTVEAMEEALPTLPLVHYRNIWDPASELRNILAAISRAKDELADAEQYKQLSQAMKDSAKPGDAQTAAEKCLEVAQVYAVYEKLLASHGALDFGDLIMKPTLLLEKDKAVCTQVQMRHRHVLVDEYQDVNRASARLLKAVVGDGKRLWVVGDTRQAIYRFRGASASNMSEFRKDYPTYKPDQLEVNYRSVKEVVDTFVSIAPQMGASQGMLELKLSPKRGAAGFKPEIRRLQNPEDELAAIAASIRELEKKGVELQEQAVLCRGNSRLADIAAALEARGIPSLYLGNIFERDEARDLLSFLSLVVDPFCDSLIRVAAMPRYAIPLQDVYVIAAFLREKEHPALEGLRIFAASPKGVSKAGVVGLLTLVDDLKGFQVGSLPWDVLSTYLLDRTGGARRLSEAKSLADFMRAIAVWQLLNFVREQPVAGKGLPIKRLLDRIRQLMRFADERELRRIPDAAQHLNAMRLMTVHKSKGLEFEAVHIATVEKTRFPLTPRLPPCLPPVGLISGTGGLTVEQESLQSQGHEEECLFFVALSRARTYLHIYLTEGSRRKPSPFLDWLSSKLVGEVATPPTMPAVTLPPNIDKILVKWNSKPEFSDGRFGSYERCPRRFFYTNLFGLGGAKKHTAFTRTHDCIFALINWLAEARANSAVSLGEVEKQFEKIWKENGPCDHAFAADYRRLADRLAKSLHELGAERKFRKAEPLGLDLTNGRVVVEPHEIAELRDGSVILRRIRTGSKKDDEFDELQYTLYQLAGEYVYGATTKVEAVHLGDGTRETASISAAKLKNRREKAENFLAQIKAGEFPASPSDRVCPSCPHFFHCGAVAPGPLTLA